MKFLLIVPGYPSTENPYCNGFVHRRVKAYSNTNIEVFSVGSKNKSYSYDGVVVQEGDLNLLQKKISSGGYDKFLVHFGYRANLKALFSEKGKQEVLIWVHGFEGLGWYRRLFNLDLSLNGYYQFIKSAIGNVLQMSYMRQVVLNQERLNVKFIFVSNWMKSIFLKDTFCEGIKLNCEVVPNVVDNKLFDYAKKDIEQRVRILSIRPYASRKYANDISVKAVLELSKEDFFHNLIFSFYGKGYLFDKTLEPLKKFKNIKIYNHLLNQKEIANLHKLYGVLLIPTRQDAQGVSMCEGMSSGLVPITSDNTAIPEFVTKDCGFLTKDHLGIAAAIKTLYYNPKIFQKMSYESHFFIKNKCEADVVIQKEKEIIYAK